MTTANSDRPATAGDINRLHDRLDELVREVSANVALCAQCRPKVMGNGKPSYGERLTALETEGATNKTWLGVIGGILGGIVALAGRYFVK